MTTTEASNQSGLAKWGWGILLVVSAFLVLNGIGWFFMGGSLSTFEQDRGIPLEDFRQAYPTVAASIAVNARQVAIWFVAVGLLSFTVARQGFRQRTRWAWNTAWILVVALAAVGVNVLVGGELAYGLMVLGLAAIALVGQLLAGRELAS